MSTQEPNLFVLTGLDQETDLIALLNPQQVCTVRMHADKVELRLSNGDTFNISGDAARRFIVDHSRTFDGVPLRDLITKVEEERKASAATSKP